MPTVQCVAILKAETEAMNCVMLTIYYRVTSFRRMFAFTRPLLKTSGSRLVTVQQIVPVVAIARGEVVLHGHRRPFGGQRHRTIPNVPAAVQVIVDDFDKMGTAPPVAARPGLLQVSAT